VRDVRVVDAVAEQIELADAPRSQASRIVGATSSTSVFARSQTARSSAGISANTA
jgi:hypothetical protein